MSEPHPEAPPVQAPKGNICPTCGGPMRHRSREDHGMYWAILQRAFDNWPIDHRFTPTSKQHLHGSP